MPIDAYSPCPGGLDRKIKFCCADLLGELQKIDRMIEGQQYLACLRHIERLQEHGQQRACLLAIKAQLLRETEQWEAAQAHLTAFLQRFPDNPVALAESAIVRALREGGRAGLAALQQLFGTAGAHLPAVTPRAIGVVAGALLADGHLWVAGRAMLQLQMTLDPDNQSALQALLQVNSSPHLPLVLKSELPWTEPPANAPWKARFEEALEPLRWAHWQGVADRLTALAAEVPDAPVIWHYLAMVRGWLADDAGWIAALRKLASLPIRRMTPSMQKRQPC